MSALIRSVWVSTAATSARRSSAKCSRSALSVSGREGTGAGLSSAAASAGASTGVKLGCSTMRRSETRCSWFSTLETSVGRICFGSTPTAPSARA